ncbi:MAG: DUF1467 family protein [Rhodomicrobium sp.]|nr:DUF1467 family protein [Rhodomicrobium sp.]
MTLPVGLGIYFICWWLAFFIVLPIGVRTQLDEDRIEPGTADSAPVAPRLWIKALAATVVSAVIFAAAYAVIAYRLIPLD